MDRYINSLRPRQNVRLFADDTFKRNFLNENIIILIKISLKFVHKGLINNIPALVLVMAWRRPGDKPLSELMLVRSLTHICVTRPQWVNILKPSRNDWHLQRAISTAFSWMEYLNFQQNYIEMSFHVFDGYYIISIDVGNGLAPNRQQAKS